MRRTQALSLAAATVAAAGILATAWPAFADDASTTPSVSESSAEPSPAATTDLPLPPQKPIPSGPTTETPPTADPSVTPPPMPSFPPDDEF